MRATGAVLAILVLTGVVVSGCASLVGKWKPAASLGSGVVTVEPRQPWTDTGIEVTAGELLFFTATGHVSWASGGNPRIEVGPDGHKGSPGWNVGRGGLIGRVGGAGKPFDIGARTSLFPDKNSRGRHRYHAPPPIQMPGSGRLYLGFKKYSPGDHSGSFEVTIRAAEPVKPHRG